MECPLDIASIRYRSRSTPIEQASPAFTGHEPRLSICLETDQLFDGHRLDYCLILRVATESIAS